METDWLDDFLAIVEHSGFSRAAEARNVTQPALSRRIRALEDWVGAQLFLRTTHKVLLTPAGELFRITAEDVLRRLASGQLEAKEQAESTGEQLRFAATNALALTFFPEWLRRVEVALPIVANIQLVANHMEACERIMLQGRAQFLLGHHHPSVQTQLGSRQFLSHKVGIDVLIPVAAPTPASKTTPLFTLPGTEAEPIPYLSYRPESGMGSIVAAVETPVIAQGTVEDHLQLALGEVARDDGDRSARHGVAAGELDRRAYGVWGPRPGRRARMGHSDRNPSVPSTDSHGEDGGDVLECSVARVSQSSSPR